MTFRLKPLRLALLLGLTLGAAACQDEIPTATGAERFPAGTLPQSVDLVLPASDFLLDEAVFRGLREAVQATFLLVANQFDGSLDAHVLARFEGFPDSVRVEVDGSPQSDTLISFSAGRVVAAVDTAASVDGPVTLQLWSLAQPWDPQSVGWELAVDSAGEQVPWRVDGGTPARLLSRAVYSAADTLPGDTVAWQLDSLAVEELQRPGFPGLLITAETPGSRLELSRLALELDVRSTLRPDTTVVVRVVGGAQRFVFTPEAPRPDSVLRVGGLTGDRSVLRLDLSTPVPLCDPALGVACGTVPLSEVTLNQVSLLLDPLAVPGGFRPLAPVSVSLRRLVEPELGLRAPLGALLAVEQVRASLFAGPRTPSIALDLTATVRALLEEDSPVLSAVLLSEPEGAGFGYAWFDPEPRLRIVYTLPTQPVLP